MIDIETLGLEPGAAILSIGAVTFSESGLGDPFYEEVSLPSCQSAGLEIDAGTLDWWLNQSDQVNSVLTGGQPLEEVLAEFTAWLPATDREIWANSPSFDCAILEAAYQAVGREAPWTYEDKRDVRTIKSLPIAPDLEMEGNEHDALDDAKYQARVVSETLRALDREDNNHGPDA